MQQVLRHEIPALHQLYSTGSRGTLDTLRSALRNMVRLIDSVRGPMRYDVFRGIHASFFCNDWQKGWKPGEAIEKMVPTGDSATIELNLELLISMENLFQKHSVRLRNGRR